MIWDELEGRDNSDWISVDSGIERADVILRSVVEKCGLQTFALKPDQPSIGLPNGLSTDASEQVIPEWHYWAQERHEIQRDARFLVVQSLPNDVDMVLEDNWLPGGNLSSLIMQLNPQEKALLSTYLRDFGNQNRFPGIPERNWTSSKGQLPKFKTPGLEKLGGRRKSEQRDTRGPEQNFARSTREPRIIKTGRVIRRY